MFVAQTVRAACYQFVPPASPELHTELCATYKNMFWALSQSCFQVTQNNSGTNSDSDSDLWRRVGGLFTHFKWSLEDKTGNIPHFSCSHLILSKEQNKLMHSI